jgi:Cu+-exporting ATPase
MCCCGRLLWVGEAAEERVQSGFESGTEYVLDRGSVTLPWGEAVEVLLAVPSGQLTASAPEPAEKVRDVVCGMMIDPKDASTTSTHQGETYYFCALACKTAFDADPMRYLPKRGLLRRLLG